MHAWLQACDASVEGSIHQTLTGPRLASIGVSVSVKPHIVCDVLATGATHFRQFSTFFITFFVTALTWDEWRCQLVGASSVAVTRRSADARRSACIRARATSFRFMASATPGKSSGA